MADPEGVLGEIVARKRIDVRARLGNATLGELGARAAPSTRSLSAALTRRGARFIMEVKRASPSGGAIRMGADAGAVARGYRGAADAVSVLTDAPYFGGSLADLAAVRLAFDGPVLAKDFVVDPRQIAEARLHGADAVLVMLSVLDDVGARACLATAARLGMEALVEAHDEVEIRRAVALGARIVGINNRDLRTLEVDLATTERLAPLVPDDSVLVSESGVATRADVARLAPLVDAFLVGSSLMLEADPAAAARALVFGRVKVCGLTTAADIVAAHAAGASFGGLIMVPGSPRALTPAAAQSLAAQSSLPVVGVFRDASATQVADFARSVSPAALQLHGREDGPYIKALAAELPPACEIWACAAATGKTVEPARPDADRTLFDTAGGGTGHAFDWRSLANRADRADGILAGGLNTGNAAAAAAVGTWALDVASGVESAPGIKDRAKLGAFFDALRATDRGVAVAERAELLREGPPCV